jgi:hypothetical protein
MTEHCSVLNSTLELAIFRDPTSSTLNFPEVESCVALNILFHNRESPAADNLLVH